VAAANPATAKPNRYAAGRRRPKSCTASIRRPWFVRITVPQPRGRGSGWPSQGNPLAAGLVAFGTGLLLATLFPPTKAEERAASAVQERVEPLKDQAREAGREVKDHLHEKARESAQQVKDTASKGTQQVTEQAKSSAEGVTEQAKSSAEEVKGRAGSRSGGRPSSSGDS
jgi:hypothetical protein